MVTVTNSEEKSERRVFNWDKYSAVNYNFVYSTPVPTFISSADDLTSKPII